MANTILTNDLVAKYVAAYFRNYNKAIHCAYMPFGADFDRDINGYNVGNNLRFRLPNYVNTRTGVVSQSQNLIERFANITLDRPIGADWNPNVLELTTDMDSNEKIIERFVKPSVIKLANQVDSSITSSLATSVYNVSGTAGSTVNSFSTFNTAVKMLDKFGIVGDKMALMNIDDAGTLQNSVSNFFNSKLNEDVGIDGMLGHLAGVDIFQDQNIGAHTNGTFLTSGNVTVATNVTSGDSSINLIGFNASASNVLHEGDIITVAGVFAVNIVSSSAIGVGTPNLAKFIVTANVSSDGAGAATVPVQPVITFSPGNPYNNVSKLPAASEVVTLIGGGNGTYTNNYVFTKDAILLAVKPYFRPAGLPAGSYGSYVDDETDLSFSVIDWFNGDTFSNLKRCDLLYGFKIQPEYVVRLIG